MHAAVVATPPVGEDQRHLVLVGAEADPGALMSLATIDVAALLGQLLPRARDQRRRRRPVSAAKPTSTGRAAAAVAAQLGEQIRVRRQRQRQRLPAGERAPRQLAGDRRRRAKVGDGGGHDHDVGGGGAAAPSARPHLLGGLDVDRASRPRPASAARPGRRSSVTRAPRAAAAAAIAKPIFPDDRLPRKRTSSIGSRVGPAVDHDVPPREIARGARRPVARRPTGSPPAR